MDSDSSMLGIIISYFAFYQKWLSRPAVRASRVKLWRMLQPVNSSGRDVMHRSFLPSFYYFGQLRHEMTLHEYRP